MKRERKRKTRETDKNLFKIKSKMKEGEENII